jgi:predicted permease
MDGLLRDLRLAFRGLRRTPGFTAAAIITLALGIGATTALFSVVDAVLMRPLGWSDESRLYSLRVDFTAMHIEGFSLSIAEMKDLKALPVFESVAAYTSETEALLGPPAERVQVGAATSDFFRTLGVQPLYGRSFTEAEEAKGAAPVALLSWSTFRKRYASDPAVVGREVVLDGRSHTIIGVLPESFTYGAAKEFYVPLEIPANWQSQRGAHYLDALGRLKPGVTPEAARRALADLSAYDNKQFPDDYPGGHGLDFRMTPLRDRFVGSAKDPLLLLLGAVFVVLLIACANVANLLLARSAARQGELAVRAALGAGRGRLVRQLLTESALLAALGAGLGIAIASWGVEGLLAAAPRNVRVMSVVSLDLRVLGFALGVTALCTIVFGLAPALHASRADLASALKDGARSVSSRGRLRSLLVAGQFALSLTLLASAGLVLRSFEKVLLVSPGFDPEGVIEAAAYPGGAAYDPDPARQEYFDRAWSAISAIPGVESVGAIDRLPTEGNYRLSYLIEGYTPAAGEAPPSDLIRRPMAGYFRTMRQAVVAGREFQPSDDAKAPLVALVNEAWVRRYFPGRNVVGQRIRMDGKNDPWRTIVGVVADAREAGLDRPAPPVYYFPSAQMPADQMTFVLRGRSPQALVQPARAALAAIDRAQPPGTVRLVSEALGDSLAPRKFPLQLLGVFAGLALLLSAVGIYGVTSYAVAQRTREFGVRMAIGASGGEVVRMVLRRALVLALGGVGFGLLAALAGARVLSSLLYGVSERDPITYFVVVLLLSAVALVASVLPAVRASRIDPMAALRAE